MRLSLATRTVDGTAGAAAAEIITGATPGRVKIKEIGIFLAAATASVYAIGRPAVNGITPTSPIDFLPEDPDEVLAASVVSMATAWGTGPTVPAAFFRRISMPATIGTGVIFTFENLVIPVSDSIVIWNIGTNGVADVYAVVEI